MDDEHGPVWVIGFIATLGAGVVLGFILFWAALLFAADHGLYNVMQGPSVEPLPLDRWAALIMLVCILVTTSLLGLLYKRVTSRAWSRQAAMRD